MSLWCWGSEPLPAEEEAADREAVDNPATQTFTREEMKLLDQERRRALEFLALAESALSLPPSAAPTPEHIPGVVGFWPLG